METLVVNLSGAVRRTKFEGRDYLVAPVSLLVPGVLNGSKGPLLYRSTEAEASARAWNNMPIIYDHRTDPLQRTARTPEILEAYGIGRVYNSIFKGKLSAEAWLDIERANGIDPRIIPAIERREKVEVSTGLSVDVLPEAGVENGITYVGIVTNYRPDHLAVLMDGVGACSVRDGCGINNERESEMLTLSDAERKTLVDTIVTNCSCWKEEDRETLNKLDGETLQRMGKMVQTGVANSKALQDKITAQEPLVKAAQEGFKAGNTQYTLNEKGEWVEKKEEKKVENAQPTPKPITLQDLPEEVQNQIAYGAKRMQEDKNALIGKLVANVSDASIKEAQIKRLQSRSIEDLEADVALVPAPIENKQQTPQTRPNFQGAWVANQATENAKKPEPLGHTVWNFERETVDA